MDPLLQVCLDNLVIFSPMAVRADPRECICLRCTGETCSCHMGHPPCSVCTDSCDPDDPSTRLYASNCPICGCYECGCARTSAGLMWPEERSDG